MSEHQDCVVTGGVMICSGTQLTLEAVGGGDIRQVTLVLPRYARDPAVTANVYCNTKSLPFAIWGIEVTHIYTATNIKISARTVDKMALKDDCFCDYVVVGKV